MEGKTSIAEAKEIMGENFIGIEELLAISNRFPLLVNNNCPDIPFSKDILIDMSKDYLLIFGVSEMRGNKPLTLITIREFFGINPDISEPCFYNQDWYINEDFASTSNLENKWYLIQKNVMNDTRGNIPSTLVHNTLPTALLCAYTFILSYILYGITLWKADYIWCNDHDNYGDRVYIGNYCNKLGKRNGFEIHRHLSIKNNYGCINFFIK